MTRSAAILGTAILVSSPLWALPTLDDLDDLPAIPSRSNSSRSASPQSSMPRSINHQGANPALDNPSSGMRTSSQSMSSTRTASSPEGITSRTTTPLSSFERAPTLQDKPFHAPSPTTTAPSLSGPSTPASTSNTPSGSFRFKKRAFQTETEQNKFTSPETSSSSFSAEQERSSFTSGESSRPSFYDDPLANQETVQKSVDAKTVSQTSSQSSKLLEEAVSPSLDLNSADDVSFTSINSQGTLFVYLTLLVSGLVFMVIWYKKQIAGKIKPNKGLSVDVLGQTWLDGQTKLMLVKLGGKVIVLAKSQQFCSAIDTITDPEQIKLLTLGAGAAESGEDFGAILKEVQPKSAHAKRDSQTFEDKPSEAQIKSELDRLKRELGHMGARS